MSGKALSSKLLPFPFRVIGCSRKGQRKILHVRKDQDFNSRHLDQRFVTKPHTVRIDFDGYIWKDT